MDSLNKKVKNTITTKKTVELLPTKGVSVCWKGQEISVLFGHHIDEYKEWIYKQIYSDSAEGTCYELFDERLCSVFTDPENGIDILDHLLVEHSCIWQGHELIGMPYEEFESLFHLTPEDHDANEYSSGGSGPNWRYYDIYYFTEQGFDLWVWRKRIRFIFIYDPITLLEDDELERALALRNASHQ